MDRIVVVLNARRSCARVIDFAGRIAASTGSLLTGMFIENIYFQHIAPEFSSGDYFHSADIEQDVITDTEQSVRLFRYACDKNKIRSELFVTRGEPIREVLFNSRFTDLMILDPSINFYHDQEDPPSHLVKEILKEAECPVILAPLEFDNINEVVFCYDGSASSAFAIKQFTALFHSYADKKVTLLEVKRRTTGKLDKPERWLMEWLRLHYETADYDLLIGTMDHLSSYFRMKKNAIVVMGAYGRNSISQFFRKSSADPLVRKTDLSIFIAHH